MPEKFRLYLDQMIRVEVAHALRNAGHNVIRASETGHARADDKEILEKAISENRVLITFDKHFGDWVVLPLKVHPGVIRLKIIPPSYENAIKLLLPFLEGQTPENLVNHLVILSSKKSKWIRTG